MSAPRVLFLYDDDIAVRLPAHYRLPLFDLLRMEHGIGTDVICFNSSTDRLRVEDRGEQRIVHLPKVRPASLAGVLAEVRRTSLLLEQALDRVMEGRRHTHIVAFNYPLFLSAARRRARRTGARCVIHIGFLSPEELLARPSLLHRVRGAAGRWLRNRTLRAADEIWAMSEAMRTMFIERYGLDAARIRAWPSAVETGDDPATLRAAREDVRTRYGIPADATALVYVGSVARIRQPEMLLDIMREVVRRGDVPRPVLHVFGYAPSRAEMDALRAASTAHGLDSCVRIHDAIPESDLPAVIAACDIGLSPIPPIPVFTISSPIKILEYLRAGTPAVANDIPDQRLVLEGSGAGRLCGWDAADAARAVAELAALGSAARAGMGEAGYAWVCRHRDVRALTAEVASWLRS